MQDLSMTFQEDETSKDGSYLQVKSYLHHVSLDYLDCSSGGPISNLDSRARMLACIRLVRPSSCTNQYPSCPRWIMSPRSIHCTLTLLLAGLAQLVGSQITLLPLQEDIQPHRIRNLPSWVRDLSLLTTSVTRFKFIPCRRMTLLIGTAFRTPFQHRQSSARPRNVALSPTRNTSPSRYRKNSQVQMTCAGDVQPRSSFSDSNQ